MRGSLAGNFPEIQGFFFFQRVVVVRSDIRPTTTSNPKLSGRSSGTKTTRTTFPVVHIQSTQNPRLETPNNQEHMDTQESYSKQDPKTENKPESTKYTFGRFFLCAVGKRANGLAPMQRLRLHQTHKLPGRDVQESISVAM